MSQHTDEHDRDLLDWLVGSEGADGNRDAAPHADCDTCRARWEELQDQEAALKAAGTDLRRVVERAEKLRDLDVGVPGEEHVEVFFAARLKPERFTVRLRAGLAAAALLAIAATLWLRGAVPPGPTTDRPSTDLLGGSESVRIRPRSPVGSVPRYVAFAWDGTLPPEWTATIHVFDGNSGAESEPVDVSRPLLSSPWLPTHARTSPWPDHIRWEIQLHDGSDRVRLTVSASASRSSH